MCRADAEMLQGPTSPPMETSESASAGGSLESPRGLPRTQALENKYIYQVAIFMTFGISRNQCFDRGMFILDAGKLHILSASSELFYRRLQAGKSNLDCLLHKCQEAAALQDSCSVKDWRPTHQMENSPNQRRSFLICVTRAHRKHFFKDMDGS